MLPPSDPAPKPPPQPPLFPVGPRRAVARTGVATAVAVAVVARAAARSGRHPKAARRPPRGIRPRGLGWEEHHRACGWGGAGQSAGLGGGGEVGVRRKRCDAEGPPGGRGRGGGGDGVSCNDQAKAPGWWGRHTRLSKGRGGLELARRAPLLTKILAGAIHSSRGRPQSPSGGGTSPGACRTGAPMAGASTAGAAWREAGRNGAALLRGGGRGGGCGRAGEERTFTCIW